MQSSEFHEVVAQLVGELHASGDLANHFAARFLVVVEGPAPGRVIALGLRLGNVMDQGGEAQFPFAAEHGRIIHHLQGMQKHVFVALPVDEIHARHDIQFGEHLGQQTRLLEDKKADTGLIRTQQFHGFLGNPLPTDDFHTLFLPGDAGETLRYQFEPQLGREPGRPQHAQGVIAEGNVGIQRCAQNAIAQVLDAAERIGQVAVSPRPD